MDIVEIKTEKELKKRLGIPNNFKMKFLTNEEMTEEIKNNKITNLNN